MRTLAICTLALFATSAAADEIVLKDASVQYGYTYNKVGSLNFCDLVTVMAKAPMIVKLTAAFVRDDKKPKDQDLRVAYMVEAMFVRSDKSGQQTPHEVKVVRGRIISDVFHSDLHATKNVDSSLGASYNIPSEGSLALFTNVLAIQGRYQLAIDFEGDKSVVLDVKPTPKLFDASSKWTSCSIALMEHRPPQ